MIVVEDVHKHFGGFRAVDGASLEIAKGSITGLIGEWRRQDHAVQRDCRAPAPHVGPDPDGW